MVAGGGASVIYSDTICDMGFAAELANYGEYSGAPSEQQTYEYAKTILSLIIKEKHPDGKILIIGGGIANFTNVAATFKVNLITSIHFLNRTSDEKGIVKALREYRDHLVEHKVSIFVRRAGPNYQEGLRVMREVGASLGIPIHVFGPETHMTAIVGMALGKSFPCSMMKSESDLICCRISRQTSHYRTRTHGKYDGQLFTANECQRKSVIDHSRC
jgi:ATP citrate (pro-S)-lyase